MDLNLGEPGSKTKHIKLLVGLLFTAIGAIFLAQSVNLLPFTIGVNPALVLQITSLGSLIGGLYLIWGGLKRAY